ncbi:iron ABC transporter permease [bacterium]|nr:iron ABC transporter permease [bacterium]
MSPQILIKARKSENSIENYRGFVRRKIYLMIGLGCLLVMLLVVSIAIGSYHMSLSKMIKVLLGLEQGPQGIVIWQIRMPRIFAAIVTGSSLGLSGLITQSLLRNSLASPFTLGISQGAAFGAAFSIVILGAGGMQGSALRTADANMFNINSIYTITVFAFIGAITATSVILALARFKSMSPESIILSGVALSSLFTSGTILVQYFATEVEIATVVFWTFGDVARSNWSELGLLSLVTGLALIYFIYHRWNLNAIAAGDEAARGLGVEINRVRLVGMLLAALIAALATAFHGVIAFLGLLAPHIGRRLASSDHGLSIPFSCLIGSVLLLLADTLGRLLVGSGTLPVGVLTSFMGAPLFLYLLIRGLNR